MISSSKVLALAASTASTMKQLTAMVNKRLTPTRALIQPMATIIAVLPRTKAVATQEICTGVAEKVPCMWGKAMPITTRSVTYMELAMMTVAMTITRWVRPVGSFFGSLVITTIVSGGWSSAN